MTNTKNYRTCRVMYGELNNKNRVLGGPICCSFNKEGQKIGLVTSEAPTFYASRNMEHSLVVFFPGKPVNLDSQAWKTLLLSEAGLPQFGAVARKLPRPKWFRF